MERIVFCIVALFVVCYAQVPTPCQSPKQWEGDMVLFDASKDFTEKSRIIYDETNMRERTIEEIEVGKERDYYEVLRLFNERKEYRLNLRTKKCNVTTIMYPFRVRGVPSDAKFLFEGVIGASSIPYEHFTAVTFGGEYTTDHVKYATTVTFPDCIPVADNYYNDVTSYVESRYFDIHAGITDPMAFIPPTECA
ncbi:mammalian ependymin-related protein 1-like [Ruditapes philippinarum]|uniref:mammalian ependymin-related protein 1-like n=1 Tax=Ruditapes philippinarum TaxID=129788 RepID=UPI00295B4EF8|nr:mammalian ependymin-related protein 1-like [Ruditapes philippinarum]